MIVAVTGHRPNKLDNNYDIAYNTPMCLNIRKAMTNYIASAGVITGISGMALGIDTMWAMSLLDANIPFIAALPFKGQETKWSTANQAHYSLLLGRAKDVVYICDPGYAAWKMQRRNEFMVDNCNALLAFYNGDNFGGTYNCINYAIATNKLITIINPITL